LVAAPPCCRLCIYDFLGARLCRGFFDVEAVYKMGNAQEPFDKLRVLSLSKRRIPAHPSERYVKKARSLAGARLEKKVGLRR